MRTDVTVEILRKAIKDYAAHTVTEVKVIPSGTGESYQAVLVRGTRESGLSKIFSREFVEDLAGTKEYQQQLQALVNGAFERLWLKDDVRRAAILAALDSCNDHWPGKLIGASSIQAYYARYTGGDVIHQADLVYLSDKGHIELYRRTAVYLQHAKTGTDLDLLGTGSMHLAQELYAARILAEGRDRLDDWRSKRAEHPAKIYEIFISSCQDELEDQRIAAREAVEDDEELRKHFKVISFEDDMTPSSGSPRNETTDAARRCDIYVGLFAARYGISGSDGVSPTEREYRAVTNPKQGKEVWIFRHVKFEGQEEPRLKQFLDEITDPEVGHSYGSFKNIKELKFALRRRLRQYLERKITVT